MSRATSMTDAMSEREVREVRALIYEARADKARKENRLGAEQFLRKKAVEIRTAIAGGLSWGRGY